VQVIPADESDRRYVIDGTQQILYLHPRRQIVGSQQLVNSIGCGPVAHPPRTSDLRGHGNPESDCLTVKQGEGYCRSGPPAPENKTPEASTPDTPAPQRIRLENDAPEAQAPAPEAPFETRTFNETPDSAPSPETTFPEPQG